MKFWTIAGVLTGLLLVTLAMRKTKRPLATIDKDANKRYNIDDFIAEQEL